MKYSPRVTPLLTLIAAACFSYSQTAFAKDITLGHMTYHTGEYAGFGEFFDAITDFSLEIINTNPPLGRNIVVTHEDAGTIGEARTARKLIRKDNIDILLNSAHHYESYRTTLLKRIEALNKPLLPSVHGGAINPEFGGTAAEPLFRGSPMDSAQSVAAMLYIKNSGYQSVVIVHTTLEGHVAQKDAAKRAAEKLGIAIIDSIEIQPDWTDYSSIARIVDAANADVVVMLTTAQNGGLFLKNAADAGFSWPIVGTSEWLDQDFVSIATNAALKKHKSVVFSAHSHTTGPAWDFYSNAVTQYEAFDKIGDPANSYATQYYDLLVVTALAIEKAGKVNSKLWAEAMYEITSGTGEVVYTYEDGINALREGKDINYDGVTGTMEYTATGVVAGQFGIFRWSDNNELELVNEADGNLVAELDQ